MKLVRECMLDGKTYEMDIPSLTPELLQLAEIRHYSGELVQNIFPNLSPGEREFIMTGTPPHVWEKMFGPGEDS